MSIRRILAAGGVLAMGWFAATPFYRSQSSPSANRDTGLSLRETARVAGGMPVRSEPVVGSSFGDGAARRSLLPPAPAGSGTVLGRPMEERAVADPVAQRRSTPAMADSFRQAIGERSAARWTGWQAPVQPPVSRRVEAGKPILPSQDFAEPAHAKRCSNASRRHVIRDGDTLEFLSARYYGSEEFAGFLFASNSGTLPAPDLLPIGVTIEIPAVPRHVALPSGTASEPSQGKPRSDAEDDGLVPVEWPS